MSRSVKCIAYIALFLALMSTPCAVGQDLRLFATVEGASDYAQAIAKGRRTIHASMEQGNPGMSIAVGVHGEIVWVEALDCRSRFERFGYGIIEHRIPVTAVDDVSSRQCIEAYDVHRVSATMRAV